MTREPGPDLHWTAFLYIAGELDPEAEARFEDRLAEDAEAQEAVALAVEVVGATVLAARSFAAKNPTRRRIRLASAWVALAAAAGLALALFPSFGPPSTSPADPSATARAWSTIRDEEAPDWSPSVSDASAEPDEGTTPEPQADRALPSWLLSAASVPADESPREED